MSGEQWLGVGCMLIGAYLVVCSLWVRDFFLYRMKTEPAVAIFGAKAHVLYSFLGGVLFLFGAAKMFIPF